MFFCLATVCAVDGIPSGMSHDWDAIAFGNLVMQIVQTVTCTVDVYLCPPCLVDPMSLLVRDTLSFDSVCKFLFSPSSALIDDATVEELDCSSLTLGEACVVTCADGHTAAGDIEITMTCVFDLELTGILLEDSTHSGRWASCDLSTLAPLSTANHDWPKTVVGKSCVVNCSYAISGTAAFTVLAGGQYFTCEALTGFIGDHLLNGSVVWI